MRRPAPILRTSYAAALLAVALLVIAGVRSNVMQVTMALAPADCGMGMAMDMSGGGGGGGGGRHAPAPNKAKPLCDFCVAAAQAPLTSAPPVIPPPMAVVWRPAAVPPDLGARGPPSFQPRARGPPAFLTA